MPLTSRIFIGLSAGILFGFVSGEALHPLKAVGEIYIGLMQMTVLPFIVFSLTGSIGQLSPSQLRILGHSGLWTYLLIWSIVASTLLAFALAFPDLETSRFFSSSLIEAPPEVDWIKLFVPANPFRALSENAVPAVVIFCILFGVGLIGSERQEAVTEPLRLCARSLHRVNAMVVRITPFGIFAIAAHAVGTTPLREFERLEAYYLVLAAGILVTTFIILPLLVSTLTGIRYRAMVRLSLDSLMTAFVTGSVLSSLPVLIETTKSYYQSVSGERSAQSEFAEFILPLAYPFPNSGNIAALLFIPFSAWFVGERLGLMENIHLLGLGTFLMFGKVFLAIPFLLNTFHVPEDMFQLFIAAGVFAGRLSDTLGAMHYLAFTLIATARMTGTLEFRSRRLISGAGLALLTVASTIALIRPGLERLSVADDTRHLILNRTHALSSEVLSTTIAEESPNPDPLTPGESRLDRIRRRGTLRVGYQPDYLPYSFLNSAGELVGLDVDLVRKFANDLGVNLEWVPWFRDRLTAQLEQDHFDLAVSGISVTLERAATMMLSDAYLEVTLGLIVPDHLRTLYDTETHIRSVQPLEISVLEGSLLATEIHRHFPWATLTPLSSPEEFFKQDQASNRVLAAHAESGAAWTLLYPHYSVVNPLRQPDKAPLTIVIAGFDLPLQNLLNAWISLQRINGTMTVLTDYWFLGKDKTDLSSAAPP